MVITNCTWANTNISLITKIGMMQNMTGPSYIIQEGDNKFGDEATIGYDDALSEYQEYKLSLSLYQIFLPLIIILGTVGNSLSFIVMTSRIFRNNSTCFYLAILAISDTAVLYVSGLRYWIGKVTGVDIKMLNDVTCKILGGFMYHFVRHFSVWIVIAVTIDRFLLITLPHKSKQIVTVRRAKLTCLILAIVIGIIDANMIWGYELIEDCLFKKGGNDFAKTVQVRCYTNILRNTWPWIDLCIYAFIPVALLLGLNARLTYSLLRYEKKLQSLSTKSYISETSTSLKSTKCKKGSYVQRELLCKPLSEKSKELEICLTEIKTPESKQFDTNYADENIMKEKEQYTECTALNSSQHEENEVHSDKYEHNGVQYSSDNIVFDQNANGRTSNNLSSSNSRKHKHFTVLPLLISISFIICVIPITVIEILYSRNDEFSAEDTAKLRLTRTVFFMLMYVNHSINFFLYCVAGNAFRKEFYSLFRRFRCKRGYSRN